MLRLRHQVPVFRSSKETVSGLGARNSLSGVTKQRVAIVISRSLEDSEEISQIKQFLKASQTRVFVKSWHGEPNLLSLLSTLKEIEEFQPDFILAVGGGSVIDGSKIIWMLYENPSMYQIDISSLSGRFSLRGYSDFGAIPCTIGSGSEVSSSAVVFDETTKKKTPIVNHQFIPDLVVLDPFFLENVPANILLSTIADALSHCIEGMCSIVYHPLMDVFAETAIRLIKENWKTVLESKPDSQKLLNLQQAALLGGYVQNHCLVGLSHAIAHQLGSFDISHSVANAYLMPHTLAFNKEDNECNTKLRRMENSLGLKSGCENLFIEMSDNLDKPLSFQFSPLDLDMISENSLHDISARANPRSFDKNDVLKILSNLIRK